MWQRKNKHLVFVPSSFVGEAVSPREIQERAQWVGRAPDRKTLYRRVDAVRAEMRQVPEDVLAAAERQEARL